MYLKQTRQKNGRVSLSITQSYRDGKKSKNRTVANFGYLDELEKQYEDPIAHFREACRQMTEEESERNAPARLTIHPLQKVDMKEDSRKNIGSAVPLGFYNSLGIEKALRSAARKSKAGYDINAVMRLLVLDRLLCPSSKYSAWDGRGGWFFRSDFTDDDLYRALDYLNDAKHGVISQMNKSIDAGVGRDMGSVFYDVTNYHFEIDGEDELRRKGVAKNHMPKPLVQMGLLQDANAIPLTYKLFFGNTHDSETMIGALHDMKRDFSLERCVVVADKGLNCATNIAACVDKGDGFVFSQSIRGTKSTAELRNWALSEDGYKTEASPKGGDPTFKCKSRQDTKAVTVTGSDGKTRRVDVEVKVVAFWSRKYEERARHDREKTLEKAKELIAHPSKYTRATHYGAAKYVKNINFDKKTGEVIENGSKPVFDEEALAYDEACDGYYCIITSECGWSKDKIIDTYRGLWRIEETFKISKSDISSRPIYVRTKKHIEAHFLICYIALVVSRLMQHSLGGRYSVAAILEDLKKVSGSHLEGNWWLFDHRKPITEELFGLIGEEAPRKYMRLADIKKLLSKDKKVL
jgi:transposase